MRDTVEAGARYITPLQTLTRAEAVRPRMASEGILRNGAFGAIERVRQLAMAHQDAMRERTEPFRYLPGFSMATDLPDKSAIAFETPTGRVVGAIAFDTIWVDREFRGCGLGSEMLIRAFEVGLKSGQTREIFSPDGYANRSSAHRKAVQRAVERGEILKQSVLQDYQTPSRANAAHLVALGDAPHQPGPSARKRSSASLLKVLAGKHGSAAAFADDVAPLAPEAAPLWIITDSLGFTIERCAPSKVAFFRGFREFTITAPDPDPVAEAAHQENLALRDELRGLWSALDQDGERGFRPIGKVVSQSAVRPLQAVAASVRAMALVLGATEARTVTRENPCRWGVATGGNGFELKSPSGRSYLRMSGWDSLFLLLTLETFECEVELAPELLQEVIATVRQACDSLDVDLRVSDVLTNRYCLEPDRPAALAI
jgi:GNAT superfamily N-acetyltransferase